MSFDLSNKIFALDIGTRSVMGIIVSREESTYKVEDYTIIEHQERSMLDGQIHDVLAVANVIKQVKTTLEEKHGPLTEVAVAAAGRSLKTKRALIEQEIAGRPFINKEDILTIELEAVQLAQAELAKELESEDQTNFYCVGYSIIRYCLDHEEIGSLIDQRGHHASVEIIATFLPRVVVDSLISALKRADLEMAALTLEPIAAINVLIPSTMRRLNVSLVDIGAGTSDIAITSEGTVTAYGMVPFAGDEITDALSQHYLLDFPVAEVIKRKLIQEDYVEFDDILQFTQKLSSAEVIQSIQPAIQQLAEKVCKEIMRLNGKTPQAVMLIGGGALTPNLNQWVSEILGLPQNRVGIRGLGSNLNVILDIGEEKSESNLTLQGPEFVTPIGIAIAAEKHPVKYVSVTVNQTTLRLFDLRKLTVADALLASGISINKLHGKPGLGLSIELNGTLKLFPGTHGRSPSITSNGEEVSLNTPIKENDEISVVHGENGEDARLFVRDIADSTKALEILINDSKHSVPAIITINGEQAALDTELKERDKVFISLPSKLKDILEHLNISFEHLTEPKTAKIRFNEQIVTLNQTSHLLTVNGELATLENRIHEGDKIELKNTSAKSFQFHDVFRYVEVDLNQPIKGKHMILRVNGSSATFETYIQDGDFLELKFE